ncbi:hypothetical protein Z517_11558 [Fonsecaea pedrosoi CBS 271.37]|uniref:Cytochrome P450 n=1 Tax=Fonsecaea pedrosoi CBS 271.37 TaxID=1442368 RepID=A0A0D2G1V9_9EURO|nr:uncharacterized protein Z517_11558 [Fonsecaea pedrosoi CBS 271.37]KIW74788.1 hypothetical protein Z517_11558 [Fonsecaea pedrosoi CBS 271.37]
MRSFTDYKAPAGLAIVTALVSHAVYNRREPTVASFFRNLVILVALYAVLTTRIPQGPLTVRSSTVLFTGLYLTALSLSITVYRLFLHPLRRFPGPTLGKLTRWTSAYYMATGRMHEWLPAMHAKYGDIVRFGPNELSFGDTGSVKYLHGPQGARLTKGPFYDANTFNNSGHGVPLPSTRDWENHRIRRRIWDHGFAQKALRTYEPRIRSLIDTFCTELEKHDGEVVDFAKWADYFAFDAMGDLVFNKTVGLLNEDGPREFSDWVRTGVMVNAIFAQVPWISSYFTLTPFRRDLIHKALSFGRLASDFYKQRREFGTSPVDIFSHIIAGNDKEIISSEDDLEADSPTLFIAGSDTSAVVITFMFYYICSDKATYHRLREEIDQHWDGVKPLEGSSLGPETLPFLNMCIQEVLRVMPPGPNGMQRYTNKGGHMVNGIFIPENTAVSSNTLSLHHDPRYWTRPTEFVPDRWDEKKRDPTWNHDTRAYIPFSSGTFSCAGRPLAMLEQRLLITTLLRRFDLIMAPDFDHKRFADDIRSYMTIVKGALPLTVRKRRD